MPPPEPSTDESPRLDQPQQPRRSSPPPTLPPTSVKIYRELALTFLKLGATTFGGGYAMLALIHAEVVTRRKWLTDQELMDIIVIAESTPGVIAINLATFTGYRMGGILGSTIATACVTLPSFVAIVGLSFGYVAFRSNAWVAAALAGIRIAAWLLIGRAFLKFAKKLEPSLWNLLIALITISALFCNISIIILLLIGLTTGIWRYNYYLRHRESEAQP